MLTPIVESTYLNRDMCKFESSQKDGSRWQSTDSSKAYRNTSAFKCRGNYVELLHTLAAKDERLARHLETSTVFSGSSNVIQNDLIAAIVDVVRYDKKEISAATSVAAEVDESNDVTSKAQICHHVAKSKVACEVKGAFLGFDDVSNDRRAAAMFF